MDVVVSVREVSKKFRLFAAPHHRLWEAVHPLKKKFHREFWALREVSFDIRGGQTVGIIGRNGSGKSTLLSIICSVLRPTAGAVATRGRVSALLELGAGFNPQFTGRDNVVFYLARSGVEGTAAQSRLEDIERFAEIGDFFDQPVRTYSSGMFVRLAFAAAIHVDPEILVVDEALAVGDARFQHKCYQKFLDFQQAGKTVLLVTHDINAIVKHCDRALLLENGRLISEGEPEQVANVYYELLLTGEVKAGEGGRGDAQTRRRGEAGAEGGEGRGDAAATGKLRGPHWNAAKAVEAVEDFLAEGGQAVDACGRRKSYNPGEYRYGDRRATIVDYLVVCGGQVDAVSAWSGEELDIYIKARFDRAVERPMFGFSLKTLDGVVIYATNTRQAEVRVQPASAGGYQVMRVSMRLTVQAGDLFVDLGVAEQQVDLDAPLDVRRGIVHLQVRQRQRFDGLANLEARLAEVPAANQRAGRVHGY